MKKRLGGDLVLQGLEGSAANDVARGAGLNDAFFSGEGVATLARGAGLTALGHELGAAVESERLGLAAELIADEITERSEDGFDVLLVDLGHGGQGHKDLRLGHVLTLSLGDGHD